MKPIGYEVKTKGKQFYRTLGVYEDMPKYDITDSYSKLYMKEVSEEQFNKRIEQLERKGYTRYIHKKHNKTKSEFINKLNKMMEEI